MTRKKFTKFILAVVFVLIFFFLRKALIPAVIGISIAYVVNPLVDLIAEKLPMKRILCVLLAFTIVLISAGLMIWGFADMISDQLKSENLQGLVSDLINYYEQYEQVINRLLGFSPESIDWARLAAGIGGGLVKAAIGLVAAVYMLNDKEFFIQLGNKTLHLVCSQRFHGRLREILFDINDVVSAFVKGVLVDSVIVAFLSSLALSIIGIDYAVFIGCFAGIANIIPYFGPILGIGPAVVAATAAPAGGIGAAVAAGLSLFAIQQIECNFIYPRIIGKSTGLHPLFVLISVSVGGYFGGLLWMILAVPAAGIIKVFICRWAEEQ